MGKLSVHKYLVGMLARLFEQRVLDILRVALRDCHHWASLDDVWPVIPKGAQHIEPKGPKARKNGAAVRIHRSSRKSDVSVPQRQKSLLLDLSSSGTEYDMSTRMVPRCGLFDGWWNRQTPEFCVPDQY